MDKNSRILTEQTVQIDATGKNAHCQCILPDSRYLRRLHIIRFPYGSRVLDKVALPGGHPRSAVNGRVMPGNLQVGHVFRMAAIQTDKTA